jgi:hypothetical protein
VAACRAADGWTLTARAVTFNGAAAACRTQGATFDLPRTGYDNSRLHAVVGEGAAWVDYKSPRSR